MVKSSRDKFLDIVLVTGGSALLSALVLPFLPMPAPGKLALCGGIGRDPCRILRPGRGRYRVGDMSFAYPLMRGTAPLLVTIASGPLIGEYLEPRRLERCPADLRRRSRHDPRHQSLQAPGRRGNAASLALANAVVIAALHDCRWSGRAPVRQRRRLYHVGFPGYGAAASAPGPGCGGGPTWSRIAAPAGISA